ncbi:MAG TPA: efflux RND transporter periplasmic adaptor subunit [bacterium]|nr:efflux RND transporter periplasmic adaptor subunit [bacterium]
MKKRNIVIIIIFGIAIAAILLIPSASKPAAAGRAPQTGTSSTGRATGGAPAGSSGGAAATAGKRPARAGATSTFSVRTAPITRGTIQDYIETNGDIVVDSTVDVNPYVAGKLVSIKVLLGARVEAGQLLAEIDPSTPGSTYTVNPVNAPISGTITSLPASVGSKVSTTSVVARIGVLDSTGLQASARIPERYVGVLKTGLKAAISLEAYPGMTFAATVTRVSPVVDSTSRTKEIRLSFDLADPRINAGMFAKIRLNTTAYQDRITVPENAIQSDSTGDYAFVVGADNKVSKRKVDLGVTVDGVVEVKAGLKEGDIVVVEGASVLTDGATVKIVASSGANP